MSKDVRTFNLTLGYNEQGIAELPEVTAEDNGKVAKVVDGKWSVGEAGGGLPDPSSYSDGTVLIKVGDEWKAQSGYGYEGEPAFEPIEWDGDTEGRASVSALETTAYKVSDSVLTVEDVAEAMLKLFADGEEMEMPMSAVSPSDYDGLLFASYILSGEAGTYEVMGETAILSESGTYFASSGVMHVSSLTAPSAVHTIDPKFIPGGDGLTVTITATESDDGYIYSCDKTYEQITAAINEGKSVKYILSKDNMFGYANNSSLQSEYPDEWIDVNFMFPLWEGFSCVFIHINIDGSVSADTCSYTLTPD